MTTCAICQRNRSTFSINIPIEGDENDSEIKHVCGSCIDIISTLAARPLLVEIETRLARLEVFTGMVAPAPLETEQPARAFVERVLAPDEVMREGDVVRYKDGYTMLVDGWAGKMVCKYFDDDPQNNYTVTRREPAPLPPASPDAEAPAVTFAAGDDKFEVAGWDEPTPEEVACFWSDEAVQERADAIREARYGKQL